MQDNIRIYFTENVKFEQIIKKNLIVLLTAMILKMIGLSTLFILL